MKQVMAVTLAVLLYGVAFAAPAPQTTASSQKPGRKAKASGTSVAAQLNEMKQAIDAQQQQIQQLMDELRSRDQAIHQLQQQVEQNQSAVRDAQSKAETASADAAKQEQSTTALRSDVADLKQVSANTAATLQETQKSVKDSLQDKLSDLAHGKVKIGATFYGSFSHYTDTGFAPAFMDTPTTQLGPGNSGLNAFEINRAYINLFYTPDEHVTLRITPDIYRQIDSTDGAIGAGTGAQTGGTENGSYTFRLKYAYVDIQKIFGEGAFKDTKLTFGQTVNPLVDWEEGLSGHRYTYLVPWNYLSLSSTYSGVRLHGPIMSNGKEYLDYDLGVFNTASFHAIESNDKKQVMGRLTWYPFGTTADRSGFGLTAFEDYGYNTKFPSQKGTPLNRLAVLVHYQTHDKGYQIAGEYDLGRNAVSTGNMFSGVAPVAGGPFDTFNTLVATILAGDKTRQQGFAFFGHARLGHSPFSLWGLFQYFQPNTKVSGDNPLDFERTVGGISYTFEKHFEFAVGDQNFHYVHPHGLVPGGDTNAIVIWTQFNY